ncbi:hypothetical protein ACF0H5_020867 [Mactra antiquata]
MAEEENSLSLKWIKGVHVLIFVQGFAILQSIVLVALTVHWKNVRERKLEPWQPDIEVPFSTVIYKETDVLPESFEKLNLKHNETAYVGSPKDVFTALSHLAVARNFDSDCEQFNIPTPPACRNGSERPWIKMTSPKQLKNGTVPANNSSKLAWEVQDGRPRNKLQYDNGDIIANQDGYFFVTSQVVTECVNQTNNIDKPLQIHIFIKTNDSDVPRCLLENAISKCESIGGSNLTSSSVGAVFKLNIHDRLFMSISHNDEFILREESVSNYFAVQAT